MVLSVVVTIKLNLNGVRLFNVSLKIAFIFFTNVLTKRLKFSVSPGVLGCTRDFNLILFMCRLNLRMNPNFFDSFHGNNMRLGVLNVNIVLTNAIVAILFDGLKNVPVDSVMNVLYKTAAGAPTLKTTRRALGRVKRPTDNTTLDYTMACPLKIMNIVLTVLLMHGLFIHPSSVSVRRRRSAGRAFVTAFGIRGPTVFGGDVGRMTLLDCPGFIVSHL